MPSLTDIAVVIPAGPGERAWLGLLPRLDGFGDVVLSCVAGDAPANPAPGAARVIEGAPGRARQLNAGAAAATQPWLWFVHADSRPGERTLAAIGEAPEGDYIGYFDLRFYDGPALMTLNAAGAWLRSRWLGLPFGDQGLLMQRALFDRLGRFDERLDIGEDHALIWAARRAAVPLRPLRAALPTSARRYVSDGWWRVTAANLALTWNQARTWSRAAR